jgi:hypothetical protein
MSRLSFSVKQHHGAASGWVLLWYWRQLVWFSRHNVLAMSKEYGAW